MMNKEAKIFLTAVAFGFAAICVVSYNASRSTSEPVGVPYVSSFTYCAEMHYGPKATSWCGRYATGHETRQDVIHRGPFWDYEGYQVVR